MALDLSGLTEGLIDRVAEPDSRHADATAVGDDVTLQLLATFGDPEEALRRIEHTLVVSGVGMVIVELGYTLAPAGRRGDLDAGGVDAAEPLAPPRHFRPGDAALDLELELPLLYLVHWGEDGDDDADDLAVAYDGEAVVVWRSPTIDGEAGEWYQQARVALAPGARVVAS